MSQELMRSLLPPDILTLISDASPLSLDTVETVLQSRIKVLRDFLCHDKKETLSQEGHMLIERYILSYEFFLEKFSFLPDDIYPFLELEFFLNNPQQYNLWIIRGRWNHASKEAPLLESLLNLYAITLLDVYVLPVEDHSYFSHSLTFRDESSL